MKDRYKHTGLKLQRVYVPANEVATFKDMVKAMGWLTDQSAPVKPQYADQSVIDNHPSVRLYKQQQEQWKGTRHADGVYRDANGFDTGFRD